ncbi:MAG TPA: alpha/beta hydrolase [Cyclobacteriaceae bacterium]|nr:alpha/beta hydrolase [Cyclobacteriaceae bacterium]
MYNVDTYQINHCNVFTIKPKYKTSKGHILYLHGGAFVSSFINFHWSFLGDIIDKTDCTITAPDYPLAPTYTYKDVLQMVTALYKKLLSTVGSENLIISGDSAGGGIALALAQKLKVENIAQPNHIILLSPWLDLTLSNPEISKIGPADPFIGIKGLQLAANAYAGGDDLNNYLLSPINGSLDGLGKISVFVGTKEILVADTRKLKKLMEAKGVQIDYHEYKDMFHAWMFLSFPESRQAKVEIEQLINSS